MTQSVLISTDLLTSHLDQLVGLPGSVGYPDNLAAVASRVAAQMRSCGLQVDTIPTAGAPVVIGRRAGRMPFTLLLYHHYDVAPPGPWRAWNHEPFQMAERESVLYGRGVALGKGPLCAHLNAIAALLEAEHDLPCGIVIVAEGEALSGSPHLGPVLVDQHSLLRANALLSTGGDRDRYGRPCCYAGTKGLLQVRLRAEGTGHALPAGLAASVPNPLWRLIWALTHVKSDQEEILINGFYDTIDGPGRGDSKALRAASFDEAERLAAWGLPQFLFAMSGAGVVQAEATLPTCNITSITAEPSSDIAIIPTSATARIDLQLVPRQHPQAIADLLREHLDGKGLADVEVQRLPGGYPSGTTLLDDPFVLLVSNAGRHVHGEPLTVLPRGPFAQPLDIFQQAFALPTAIIGLARPDSAPLAPNERIPLPDLVRHGQLLIEIMQACGQRVS